MTDHDYYLSISIEIENEPAAEMTLTELERRFFEEGDELEALAELEDAA